MTLYIQQHTVVQTLGAAGPYSALILASPRTVVPFGAKRVIGLADQWSPTADNTVAGASTLIAYLNAASTVATIQVYSTAVNAPVPDGMTHYVLWQKAAPPADPPFMLMSWEIWSQ